MDRQDLQDAHQADFQFRGIAEKIIGCAFEVINALGAGFLESVYEKAMAIALRDKGLLVQCQFPIHVHFRQLIVGEFFADLVLVYRTAGALGRGIGPLNAHRDFLMKLNASADR